VLAFKDADGVEISYRRWLPAGDPRAIVQIAHGACEHSLRYERFATFLTGRGYAVYANDHRGHGVTAQTTGVGKAGPRGWDGMIDDLREFGAVARGDLGELPLVLFGHSMGSFLSQLFAQRYGGELAGLVLSGSSGGMEGVDESIGALKAFVDGGAGEEPVPVLGPLNADFEPARTPSDWLSRDEAEVDAYEADPMCGSSAPLTMGFVLEMLEHARDGWTAGAEDRIPKDLPILFITGEADPVSQRGKTVRELEQRYRGAGIGDVSALYYPDARHELLNEINRDEVQEDVAAWLDRVCLAHP
jgi:alpha-beta hydrolase superfamily lysophospholipase